MQNTQEILLLQSHTNTQINRKSIVVNGKETHLDPNVEAEK